MALDIDYSYYLYYNLKGNVVLHNNVTLQYHPSYHNRIAIRHLVVAFPHLHSTQNQTMENRF